MKDFASLYANFCSRKTCVHKDFCTSHFSNSYRPKNPAKFQWNFFDSSSSAFSLSISPLHATQFWAKFIIASSKIQQTNTACGSKNFATTKTRDKTRKEKPQTTRQFSRAFSGRVRNGQLLSSSLFPTLEALSRSSTLKTRGDLKKHIVDFFL